jgi:hypothetical protein
MRKIVFSGLFEAGADLNLTDDGLEVARPESSRRWWTRSSMSPFPAAGRETGQEVLYVTERCVIELTDSGLIATEIMPGIDPQRDIVDASEGRVRLANNLIDDAQGAAARSADGAVPLSASAPHARGAVAELRLDNPEKLNAFTAEMLRQVEPHCDGAKRIRQSGPSS